MSDLNKAPKREVLEVWRTGTYGRAAWHHRLECGHVAQKKRRSPGGTVACLDCLGVEPRKGYVPFDPEVARISMEQRVIAGLALKFAVAPEFVDVRIELEGDRPYAAMATITLTREILRDL